MHATDNSIHVLLIEDNPGDVRLIREMLKEPKGRKIVLEHYATLTQGLQALSKNDFSILLLDLTLPDSTGFDTFVKVYTQNPQIPIIVLTGTNDEELAIKSVRTGAQDYLIKGQIDSSLLSRSISYAIERASLLRVVQQELIERKAMESMLRKINRALRVLSECNEIVVRATDENVLAEKICDAITTLGEYQFAWIAFTESDESNSIQPIAIAGSKDSNFPEEASAWFKRVIDSPLSEAFKTGTVVVCNDVTVDKRCSNLRAEADKLGYRSFVILPLVIGVKILGVMHICSKETNQFDQEELKLLNELKEDIAYAIVSIRTEKEQRRAEEALRESEEIFDQFLTNSPILVYVKDEQHRFKKLSKSFEDLFGKPTSELIGKDLYELLPRELAKIVFEDDAKVLREGIGVSAEEKLHDRYFSSIKFPIHRESGKPDYLGGFSVDITERMHTEEALRESEDKFKYIFDYSSVGKSITMPAGEIHVNNAFCEMLGYSPEELQRKKWHDISHPDDIEMTQREVASLLSGEKEEARFIKRYFKKNGSTVWADVSTSLRRDKQGKPLYFMTTAVDITERKRAEEKLFTLALRQEAILSAVPDIIMEVNNDKVYAWANRAGIDFFGEDVIGKEASFYFEGEQETYKIVLPLFKGNENIIYLESWQRRKDGEKRLLAWWCRVLKDENGKVTGALSSASDITEHRQAEESFRKHSERLNNLHRIDQDILLALESPEAVVQTALQHMRSLLQCQRASVGIFELEKKEVQVYAADVEGKTIVQVGKILTEEVYGVIEILRKSRMEIVEDMSTVTSPSIVNTLLQAEGVQSSINVALVSAMEMYGVLNVGWENPRAITPEDIEIVSEMANQITIAIEKARLLKGTKRYAAELEQRVVQRTAQLEEANKELEAFSYSVSHDLRAPLRHVNGYVDLLGKHYQNELPEKGRHYLEAITDSVRQMGVLIDDLLKFSKSGRMEIRESALDINRIVVGISNQIREDNPERAIEWKIAQLPSVHGDDVMLRLVWENLIGNAVKFTRKRKKAKIEIGFREEDKEFVFFVRDNGVGFDMQYAQKLFGVFQRLHSAAEYEGTGIGLANVHRIITRHGGRTWAEAELDNPTDGKTGGATFYFTLPKS